jgi:hypothetical protein
MQMNPTPSFGRRMPRSTPRDFASYETTLQRFRRSCGDNTVSQSNQRSKIKSVQGYEEKSANYDCAWLLMNIKAVTMQLDERRNGHTSLLDAMAGFLTCRQQQGQTADNYLEAMKGWVDTIEHHGGSIAFNLRLTPPLDADGKALTDDERRTIVCDRTLGVALVRGANPTRYGTLFGELANLYNRWTNEYPPTSRPPTVCWSPMRPPQTQTRKTEEWGRSHRALPSSPAPPGTPVR